MKFPSLPSGDPLPVAYRWMRIHGLRGLTPWHFYDDESIIKAWRERYVKNTGKDLWPFAHRQDCMEVVGFPLRRGRTNGTVTIIDTDMFDPIREKPSYEIIATYSSFMKWFRSAISDSEDWMSEEELAAILED